jgi:Secretory lipase
MSRATLPLAAALSAAAVILGAMIPANAGAVTTAANVSTVTPPGQDPFYTPPANLASYPPGAVLRSRQVTVVGAMQPETQAAYQLLYRTTDNTGGPAAAVATVLIPASPAPGPRKLVSYQTFYDSLTLNCAPSYTMRGGNNGGSTQPLESGLIAQELQQGWDVVVPDYEGLRSEWAVGPTLGRATLDGIRAAESFAPLGLEGVGTPVGLNGYSGGAIASTWAGALAPGYAPELNIVAVAAGGIFPDIDYTMSTLDGSIWYGVQIGALVAVNRAYPQLELGHLLNAAGQALAALDGQDAFGCGGAASDEPGGDAAEFTIYPSSAALAAAPPVENVLDKLTMETAASVPTAPSFFYNAVNDELAHIQPVDQLVAYYCAHGATIDYDRDPVASSHLAGLAVYWPLALQYLENRLVGRPAPDNCPA